MTMIERVARARFAARYPDGGAARMTFDRLHHDIRAEWLRDTRCVIEAMREPTEAMAIASGLNVQAFPVWRAMIDAALAEPMPARP